MLDVAVSYNRYKFLGHEFLTWLLFTMETNQDRLTKLDKELVSLDIGNRIVLEKRNKDDVDTMIIKSDDAEIEEGLLFLKKGAIVTELNLLYKSGDFDWKFSIKGESLNISGLKVPQTGKVEKKEDIEGAVLEKIYLYEKVVLLINILYKDFIKLRLSTKWKKEAIPGISRWITSRQ